VKDRIEEIGIDPDGAEELAVLRQWLKLSDKEAKLKKAIKALDAQLDQKAFDQYEKLDLNAIQTLVVNDKWLARLTADLQGELDRVSLTLTNRIRELAERYAEPLPALINEVVTWSAKIEEHLKQMRLVWK